MKRHKAKIGRVTVGNVTVKIYTRTRPGGYVQHEVADYTNGTRRLRSFADRTEATREAERIARLLASGESTAAQIRGKDAAAYGRALELLRDCGDPLELAIARYASAVKILGDGGRLEQAAKFFMARNPDNLPPRTVREAADELLSAKSARGASARYMGDLKSRLARFCESFKVNIGDVTPSDVQHWIDGLKVAPQTAKNYRTVAGTLFSFAERRGYLAKGTNPVKDSEQIRTGAGDIGIYTPAELRKWLHAAPDDLVAPLALAAFTGIRTAELLRLDWADVDLAGGHVTVAAHKAKTASRRLVPILPALRAWLLPHARKSGPVWTGGCEWRFASVLRQAAAKAGVTLQHNGLRHSFASYRLAQVQSAAQVSLEMGNSPTMVFRHYRELAKPAEAEAWFNILPPTAADNVVPLAAANA